MLTLSPSLSLPQPQTQTIPSTFFQTRTTLHQATQLHAFSVKTGLIFHHPPTQTKLLSLYTHPSINDLDTALAILFLTPNPPLLSYNILIKSLIQNHRSHESIALFVDMLLHELVPDCFTLPCVIKGCSRLNAMEEGEQIHGLVIKIGFGSDKFVQSSLVSLYAKCGEIDYARKVFDKMGERDLVLWNSLVDGYAHCGKIEVAKELFDEMPERDHYSWTVLIDGFAKCGKVDVAREIFDKMDGKNSVSWNAMINGYMKSRNVNAAEELFAMLEMRDLITWNSMITGYDLNGKFKEAVHMFCVMLEEGFVPNNVTLVSALSTVSALAILGHGRCIHSYLVKNGCELDGVLGTLLIEMYSKCGSIESSLTVFHNIGSKKLGHWNAAIVGLGMHGMGSNAIQLFGEMLKAGIRPNAVTFIGVLNACSHAGLVDHGRHYFKMMGNEYGIEPTIEHYGCLVDMLCRAGHLREAKKVIETMPMQPNKVIWMSLLSGSRIKGNLYIGEYAAKNLIDAAPETIGCYVVLSNMYAAAGRWDKVSQIREMMRMKGIRKDPGCSSIEHKGKIHEFIVGDISHPQSVEIYTKLSEMRERLKAAGHKPDTTQVLLHIEWEEKEAELETHSERLAIAFGLINVEPGAPIRIMKNLRVCNDCHAVTMLLSAIYNREIIVRDNSRFHHFKDGFCSCNNFW